MSLIQVKLHGYEWVSTDIFFIWLTTTRSLNFSPINKVTYVYKTYWNDLWSLIDCTLSPFIFLSFSFSFMHFVLCKTIPVHS